MAISVVSGAGANVLSVDATSLAARVTLYDTAGTVVYPAAPTGSYMLPIQIRQTAATAAAARVWSMRNAAGRTLYIRNICVVAGFDGTAAVSTSRYDFKRFRTATPTGGTALTVVAKRTSYAASNVTDARVLDTGLTVTGVVFDSPAAYAGNARIAGVSSAYVLFPASGSMTGNFFEIAANDGLTIELGVAAVIGDSLTGYIEWDER